MKFICFFIATLMMSIPSQAAVVSSMSSNSSVDTRLWTLSITQSSGGSVTGSGSYFRQAIVFIEATPLPGYLFDSWTGNARGSSNPASINMDGHKTIAAVFVEDTRDNDSDELSNYQEIVKYRSNPENADTDNDGIRDNLEVTRGLDPLLSDSNSNGLSDTMEFIFDMGDLPVFSPRVGDRVRLNVRALGHSGAMRLSGRLPTGLTFSAITGIIEGKLAAAAKTSTVLIQYLNGTTVTRSIPLTIPVLPFPAALTGTWQALIYNEQGIPQGMLTTTLSSPGTWTASLDLAGATALRSARGTFDLKPAEENVNLSLRFAATTTLPQLDLALDIFGSSSLCEGDSSLGEIKGFRLAKAGEFPAVTTTMTILFDHGDHDGFAIPAGYGFATGSITPTGTIALTGQLGDSQPLRTSLRLGATGQAILWIKPYKNRASKLGGVISLHDTGVIPLTNASLNESELWWHRVPDATELSYPAGFAPISVRPRVQRHIVPLNATGLSQILGLANQAYTDVDFSGAGLAMLENNLSFPSLLTMDSAYKLLPQYPLGKPPIAWAGTIAPRTGGFTGTLTLATAIGDIRVGRITAAGILFPVDDESGAVGAGVIKIPTTTSTGAFRTGRLVLRP
jgi:hypothetical protein